MRVIKPIVLTTTSIALIAWLAYSFYQAYRPKPIRLQGQIAAQQYSISSKVAGRIDDVLVRKGDRIHKGDLIFTLHSPEIEAKLEQAVAQQKAAGAMAKKAEKGTRDQQIQASKEKWKKAKAAAQLMDKTYLRINSLYQEGVVAEQKRDEAMTQWQAARYTENAAWQMYQLAKEGAQEETKAAAVEQERMAAGAVAEVKAYAADTRIASWFEGEVSQVLLHSGELAPQGFPVVTVVDTKDAWLTLNVREDQLKYFPKDQTFNGYLPALDHSVQFKVSHIAVMGNYATWRATDASQGFDLRTFEVEARPLKTDLALRMGMTVAVELPHE